MSARCSVRPCRHFRTPNSGSLRWPPRSRRHSSCSTAVQELDLGTLSSADAAKVKLFCTEVQGRTVDRCLQLFGGYGYVRDYPIATMYADADVTRIYGGTSEVRKIIIARSLGL